MHLSPPDRLDHLLRQRLGEAGLERARKLAESSGERLDLVLTRLGLISERDLAQVLASSFGLPLAGPADWPDQPVADDRLSRKFLKDHRVLPLAEDDQALSVAVADPSDPLLARALELASGRPVRLKIGQASEIEQALERLFGPAGTASAGEDPADEDVERLKDLASEAPVVRLVAQLIQRAVDARASDIHVEPFDNELRVRIRVDGQLRSLDSPPWRLRAAIISRIKIMARLNIAERRLPQDGRLRLAVRGREIDLRVATLPGLHGEGVVLRILDRDSVELDFHRLGFDAATLGRYRGLLARPHGMLLVTGPTGSGKTTTLYTSLTEISTPDRKVITVEDPIEYQLHGVNQIQVKPQIGLSFAHVLRSVLRQDPDVIMVGEIRDRETAEIAAQASLTGHQVLATLHTNDAAGAITRLLDMGLEDYLITATVNGVAAQRLVRALCPHCRAPYDAPAGLAGPHPCTLYRAVGCEGCDGTGYLGRAALVEVLEVTDGLRRLVMQGADAARLAEQARAEGMRTLFEDGLAKARAGLTSLDDVLRVAREG